MSVFRAERRAECLSNWGAEHKAYRCPHEYPDRRAFWGAERQAECLSVRKAECRAECLSICRAEWRAICGAEW